MFVIQECEKYQVRYYHNYSKQTKSAVEQCNKTLATTTKLTPERIKDKVKENDRTNRK